VKFLTSLVSRRAVVVSMAVGACAAVPPRTERSFDATAPTLKIDARAATYTKSYALLIGNSRYENGWETLGSVPAELEKVGEVLAQHGFEVTRQLDLDGASLRTAYEEFIREHGMGDPDVRLLFFFSGHGYTAPGEKGYLVGTDAPELPRFGQPGPDFLQKSLPTSQFIEWSRQIKARHVLFVFDSFISAFTLERSDPPATERSDPPAFATDLGRPSRQFLTAGRAGEPIPGISVFAEMFVDGLSAGAWKADLNRDGYVTGMELGFYLSYGVPERRPRQHPQFAVHPDPALREGDIIFSRPAEGMISAVERVGVLNPASNREEGRVKLDQTAASGLEQGSPSANTRWIREPRNALVIGNGAYPSGGLANPARDAALVARTLRNLGFTVDRLIDANQAEMKRAIERFGTRIQAGGTGVFYYAGHGLQVGGRNYLVPVGVEIRSEADADIEGIDLNRVLSKMEAARNRVNIVILDACRNNPFYKNFRSTSRGLTFLDAPGGTLIGYATSPGSLAEDGSARNSPYTGALARYMVSPGMKIEDVFKAARRAVKEATSGRQVPWEASSLDGDFFFAPGPK
jgi:uncharacterized caspase-like protein